VDVFLGQDEAAGDGGFLFPLLMLAGLFAVFYFLLVRPNRRRRQVMERLQSELSVGDEVMTGGGLYATVAELDDRTVILETSEGVYSRYARGAIVEVVSSAGSGEPDDSSGPASAESGFVDPVERRDRKD
jgi:preprotein translocase subunit YajC